MFKATKDENMYENEFRLVNGLKVYKGNVEKKVNKSQLAKNVLSEMLIGECVMVGSQSEAQVYRYASRGIGASVVVNRIPGDVDGTGRCYQVMKVS